jgi:hypothetical protein
MSRAAAAVNGTSSAALQLAQASLKTAVLTPANAPLLFEPYRSSDAMPLELPVCAIEPQIDGVRGEWHKINCMAIAVHVEACIGFHDVRAGRERFFEKRAGKYGLAQDGRHGGHDARKREAIRVAHRLLEQYDAHAGLDLLAQDVGDTARGYKVDDLCDAFLLALQAAVQRAPLGLPLRLAGFDIGPRNFAFCLLELVALRPRAPSADTGEWRAPDPVFRLLDWGLYDLVDGGRAVARYTVPRAADAPLLARCHEDIGDLFRKSLALQAERQHAAKARTRERARATRKRKRDEAREDAPAKKPRVIHLDLVALESQK